MPPPRRNPVHAFSAVNSPGSSPLFQQAIQALAEKFTGEDQDPEVRRGEEYRELARRGNPFPYIGWQWPGMLLTDPTEIEIFRAAVTPDRLQGLTDEIVAAVTDPINPDLRLDAWQKVIMAAFCDVNISEIYIKGCTGAGKGAATGIGFNLWFDIWSECRVTLTSDTYEHALKNIFGEVAEWRRKMAHPGRGTLLSESINDTKRHYVEIKNPKQTGGGEAFSGAHGPKTIYGFDEATSSPDTFFENAEKNATKIVALANPRALIGRFRKAFEPLGDNDAQNKTGVCYGILGRRLCVTVGGLDCLNVRHRRLKKASAPMGGIEISGQKFEEGQPIPPDLYEQVKPLIPNQIDLNQFTAICSQQDKRKVDVFAHGKFPTEDPQRQVILGAWVTLHEGHWKPDFPPPPEAFGFDIARSLDGDETVFIPGGQYGMTAIHRWQYADVLFHADEAIRIARELYGIDLTAGMHPVCVDMDGLGVGTGDSLRKRGVWVMDFRGNATSTVDPRTYVNQRAEAYATLGRRLNPEDQWRGTPWAIVPDEKLRRGLVAPEKIYSPNDQLRFKITAKADLKTYIGSSPDTADACVYLFHAVRELHNLNQWFMQNSGPLTVYPEPPPPAAGSGQPQASEPTDLMEYLEQRYGGGRRATVGGHSPSPAGPAQPDGQPPPLSPTERLASKLPGVDDLDVEDRPWPDYSRYFSGE